MRKRMNLAIGWTVAASVLCTSCYHYRPSPRQLPDNFQAASEALDKLTWYVNAYGSASLSNPLIVSPDDAFKFNLDPTQFNANTFVTAAQNQISGRSAGTTESAQIAGLSLQGSADVGATQQYLAALAVYQQNQLAMARKQSILNAAAVQQFQASMLAANATSDAVQRATAQANARTALADSLQGPTPGTSNPFPAEPAPPPLPGAPTIANGATTPFITSQFAAPQTLFAPGTPGVSADMRSALMTAAGDNATNAILSLLGDPGKMAKNKRVLFGVTMISVNPGWKTGQGYSVDITSRLAFKYAFARPAVRGKFLAMKGDTAVEQAALQQLQSCVATSFLSHADKRLLDKQDFSRPPPYDGAQFDPYVCKDRADLVIPNVSAVSPMADGQALDLQSATRRQSEVALQMALSLTYAGLNTQAAAFENFAKRHQNDIETRTNNVVVNAYGDPAGAFGFHILPRLAANPVDGGSSATLGASSFPTLLIISSDDDDLRPRVLVSKGSDADTQCFVVERQLVIYETPRWIPLSEPCLRRLPSSKPCVGEMLTEEERYQVLQEVADRVNPLPTSESDSHYPLALDMRKRKYLLDAALNGGHNEIYLPVDTLVPPLAPPPNPTAVSIGPTEIEVEHDAAGNVTPKPVSLLIAGADLDQLDLTSVKVIVGDIQWIKAATVGSPVQTTPNITLVGKSIQLVFQVTSENPVAFQFTIKNTSTNILSRPLIVHPPKDRVIQRKFGKDQMDTLHFSPTVADEVLKAEIEKDKKDFPSQKADVKVRVDAKTTK